MRWRLGIDLGTNSLGWCALGLNDEGKPDKVISAGSRIFSDGRDPKSGASNAVDRRNARAMRRRRDRFKQRQAALIKYLTQDGLFPIDFEERQALEVLDPFELRAKALDEKIPLYHLGRAIFHLNQRRGFKSNRKTDRGADDESGKIAVGISRLREAMTDCGASGRSTSTTRGHGPFGAGGVTIGNACDLMGDFHEAKADSRSGASSSFVTSPTAMTVARSGRHADA